MNNKVQSILHNNPVGVIATINGDGTPYTTPLHLVYDNETVYWLSSSQSQHSQNIDSQPSISLSIWSPDETNGLAGLFIQSTVGVLDQNDRQYVLGKFVERFGAIPPALESASAYSIRLGEIDTDKTSGDCVYLKQIKS